MSEDFMRVLIGTVNNFVVGKAQGVTLNDEEYLLELNMIKTINVYLDAQRYALEETLKQVKKNVREKKNKQEGSQ